MTKSRSNALAAEWLPIGFILGIAAGVSFGVSLQNTITGLLIGLVFGVLVMFGGMAIQRRTDSSTDRTDDPANRN